MSVYSEKILNPFCILIVHMSDEIQRLRERFLRGELTKQEYDERVRDILGIGYSRTDMVSNIQAGGLAVLDRECNKEITS